MLMYIQKSARILSVQLDKLCGTPSYHALDQAVASPCVLSQILMLLDALSTVHSQKVKKAKEQQHLHNKEHFRARQKEEEEKLKQQMDLRKLFLIQGQKKEEIRSPV
ncbi:ribosome biogenesis protein BMS1 homolog [Callithrix jacchus]